MNRGHIVMPSGTTVGLPPDDDANRELRRLSWSHLFAWLDANAAIERGDISREDAERIESWFARVLSERGTVHGPVSIRVGKMRVHNARGQACYRWVGTVATRGIDGSGAVFGPPVEVYRAAGSRADAQRATWTAAARLFAGLLREGTPAPTPDSAGSDTSPGVDLHHG